MSAQLLEKYIRRVVSASLLDPDTELRDGELDEGAVQAMDEFSTSGNEPVLYAGIDKKLKLQVTTDLGHVSSCHIALIRREEKALDANLALHTQLHVMSSLSLSNLSGNIKINTSDNYNDNENSKMDDRGEDAGANNGSLLQSLQRLNKFVIAPAIAQVKNNSSASPKEIS
jgi:hypothetical protein